MAWIGSDYGCRSDHGGVTRARKLAEIFGLSIAIIDKRRSVDKMNTVKVARNIIGRSKARLVS